MACVASLSLMVRATSCSFSGFHFGNPHFNFRLETNFIFGQLPCNRSVLLFDPRFQGRRNTRSVAWMSANAGCPGVWLRSCGLVKPAAVGGQRHDVRQPHVPLPCFGIYDLAFGHLNIRLGSSLTYLHRRSYGCGPRARPAPFNLSSPMGVGEWLAVGGSDQSLH